MVSILHFFICIPVTFEFFVFFILYFVISWCEIQMFICIWIIWDLKAVGIIICWVGWRATLVPPLCTIGCPVRGIWFVDKDWQVMVADVCLPTVMLHVWTLKLAYWNSEMSSSAVASCHLSYTLSLHVWCWHARQSRGTGRAWGFPLPGVLGLRKGVGVPHCLGGRSRKGVGFPHCLGDLSAEGRGVSPLPGSSEIALHLWPIHF